MVVHIYMSKPGAQHQTRNIAFRLFPFKIYFNQTQIQTGKQSMTRMVQVLAEFHQNTCSQHVHCHPMPGP